MRVLVVDDSAFMRKIIKEMIESDGALEVVGTARDGVEGVEKALELKPDLITLDIEMPRMNGIDALKQIKYKCTEHPPAVLMCSSLTTDGSMETLKALRLGASDFIGKDPQVIGTNDSEFRVQLINKLMAIGGQRRRMNSKRLVSADPALKKVTSSTDATAPAAKKPSHVCHSINDWIIPSKIDVIVVGSSTGGPPVLEEIFAGLPKSLPVPIIVAQHMPELFTKSLANRLNQHCPCGSVLAEHGTCLSSPSIYIAQGGNHIKPTRVTGKKIITRTIENVDGAVYKPSVDLLFSSAAELFGSGVLAIQLTGMGEDGAIGAQRIREAGGHVIAQEESSCVVYGMPRAVVDNGSANSILSPSDIHKALLRVCDTATSSDQSAPPNNRKVA